MNPATLQNYKIYTVKHATYPAILPKSGESVRGLVLYDMSDREMKILDEYEGTPQDEVGLP